MKTNPEFIELEEKGSGQATLLISIEMSREKGPISAL